MDRGKSQTWLKKSFNCHNINLSGDWNCSNMQFFFSFINILFHWKSAKFIIDLANIFSMYNFFFVCVCTVTENLHNLRLIVKSLTFLSADIFKCVIFFAWMQEFFTENRQNSHIIVKVWIFKQLCFLKLFFLYKHTNLSLKIGRIGH